MKSNIQGMVGGIALAAALACTGQAHAANDGIFTSSAQIGNLTYRLVDLDPTDGVGPSATFNISTYLSDGITADYIHYDGSLLPSTSLQLSNANQSAEASPNGVKVNSVLGTQDIASQLDPSVKGFQWVTTYSPTPSINSSAPFDPEQNYTPYASITLGANTAIAISGTASVKGSFNGANLSALLNSMIPNGGTASGLLSGSMDPSVHVKLSTSEGDLAYYYGGWSNAASSEFNLMGSLTQSFWPSNNMPTDLPEQVFENQQDFIVQYANFGKTDKSVDLEFGVQASNSLYGNVTLSELPDTPTIPEPSTYALMGLGLVGIGLARRKAAR